MKIYSDSFNSNYEKYFKKIEEKNEKSTFLDIDQFKLQKQIVEEFIKERDLKIYGGLAINVNLPENNKIYSDRDNKIVDYDVYTPYPRKNAVDLANKLFEKGFQYVTVQEGVNAGVYKVFNYFQEVIDLVYYPIKIFDAVPTITVNGMKYVTPKHLKIDLLVALTNPKQGLFRWEKDFERYNLLLKYFPTEKPKDFCVEKHKKKEYKLSQEINNILVNNKYNYIIWGNQAYYFYMLKSGLQDYYEPELKYMEIGMENPDEFIRKIKEFFGAKIVVKKYHQFLKHIPPRYIITEKKNENNILLIIYDLHEKCIPYIVDNGLKIISFNGLLLYYNFMYYLGKRHNIKYSLKLSECCLYDLERARTFYFNNSNTNRFNDNIFKEFILECLGTEKNIYRDNKIKQWKREKKFLYIPAKRPHLSSGDKVGPGTVRFISGEFEKII